MYNIISVLQFGGGVFSYQGYKRAAWEVKIIRNVFFTAFKYHSDASAV